MTLCYHCRIQLRMLNYDVVGSIKDVAQRPAAGGWHCLSISPRFHLASVPLRYTFLRGRYGTPQPFFSVTSSACANNSVARQYVGQLTQDRLQCFSNVPRLFGVSESFTATPHPVAKTRGYNIANGGLGSGGRRLPARGARQSCMEVLIRLRAVPGRRSKGDAVRV